jgi:alpha-tubulin suppressor-like RCC1 family protein
VPPRRPPPPPHTHTHTHTHTRHTHTIYTPTLPPTCVDSWGSAAAGRLGTGQLEDSPFPEQLPDLDGEDVLRLACGLDHTLALVQRTH